MVTPDGEQAEIASFKNDTLLWFPSINKSYLKTESQKQRHMKY